MVQLNIVGSAKPVIATKTLEAIDRAIEKDGGSLFRKTLRQTVAKAEDAYREEDDPYRTHLGASQIGRDCMREQWYMFRWASSSTSMATKKIKNSQMIRLLNRGHLEEARFIALLLMIGVEVYQYDSNGKQFRVLAHGGHFGGSCDSVLLRVPDCPDIPLLCECKTHNDDSFTKLISEGVRYSKPAHYDQMQTYMGGFQLRGGLYLAVNKDNDELWAELVEFNRERFLERSDRAKMIIEATIPPKKINESPGWWQCKMCRQRFICHNLPDETGKVPLIAHNCRTCKYSKPVEGGWICECRMTSPGRFNPPRVGQLLSIKEQIAGCDMHLNIEGL